MYAKKPKVPFNSDIITLPKEYFSFTCQRRVSAISTKTNIQRTKSNAYNENCIKKEEENEIFIKRYNSLKTKEIDKHFSNDLSELLSTKADKFLNCRTNLIHSKNFSNEEQEENECYDLEDVSDLELNSENEG